MEGAAAVRVLVSVLATVAVIGALSTDAAADHRVSACGQLLSYAPPPGNDQTSGLGEIRLVTASGVASYLFHSNNAFRLPSSVEQAATRAGANVCFSGPLVHSASPVRSDYVSPIELRTASAGSLPSTSTSSADLPGAPVVAFGAIVLVGCSLLALRRGQGAP